MNAPEFQPASPSDVVPTPGFTHTSIPPPQMASYANAPMMQPMLTPTGHYVVLTENGWMVPAPDGYMYVKLHIHD